MHGLLKSMHGVVQPQEREQMADSQIAQAPFKSDVPRVDFSPVMGQTWQRPLQEGPRIAQIAPTKDAPNGYLELGNWQELYGDHVQIAQAAPQKAPEAKDKVETTANKKTEKAELSVENRGASPEYANEVRKGLDSLPPHIKAELATHHVEICVFKSIDDYNKAFPAHKKGVEAGGLFDSSDPKHLRIAVFENAPDGTPVKDLMYNPAGLLRHEVGHAHSFFNGGMQLPKSMYDGVVTESKELANINPHKHEKMVRDCTHDPLNRYFGKWEEMYAEIFAIANGGGSDTAGDAYLMIYFKKLIDQVRDGMKNGN
jgi:hypothetical protein